MSFASEASGQRFLQDFSSSHYSFREGVHILLKESVKDIILNLIRFLLHEIIIELYKISFLIPWNLMCFASEASGARFLQDFSSSRHS
jgi:hypothetical protein